YCHSQSLASSIDIRLLLHRSNTQGSLRPMPSTWLDAARTMLGENPSLAGRIIRDLLKVDLPPVIQYTVLTPVCGDDPPGPPAPEMMILAGPVTDPVHAVVVEFLRGRDHDTRRRWPHYAAAVWLVHGCPVDLLVFCPDELTARWADRPVATSLDGYVCR